MAASRPPIKCEACAFENKLEESVYYCRNCQDYFCEMCTKHHNKFTFMRQHHIIDVAKLEESIHNTGQPTAGTAKQTEYFNRPQLPTPGTANPTGNMTKPKQPTTGTTKPGENIIRPRQPTSATSAYSPVHVTEGKVNHERQTTTKEFPVNVESSELATRCNIVGNMMMTVEEQEISFTQPLTQQLCYKFPLAWIRRYGNKDQTSFYFEAGRRCPNGEGKIVCHMDNAKEVYKFLVNSSKNKV